jgi:hypothetical protein
VQLRILSVTYGAVIAGFTRIHAAIDTTPAAEIVWTCWPSSVWIAPGYATSAPYSAFLVVQEGTASSQGDREAWKKGKNWKRHRIPPPSAAEALFLRLGREQKGITLVPACIRYVLRVDGDDTRAAPMSGHHHSNFSAGCRSESVGMEIVAGEPSGFDKATVAATPFTVTTVVPSGCGADKLNSLGCVTKFSVS